MRSARTNRLCRRALRKAPAWSNRTCDAGPRPAGPSRPRISKVMAMADLPRGGRRLPTAASRHKLAVNLGDIGTPGKSALKGGGRPVSGHKGKDRQGLQGRGLGATVKGGG